VRPFVSGLVLAAGASRRFGEPKQLLPFGDGTLLDAVMAQAAAAAELDEVVVVIGGAADEVRRRVALGPARVVENPDFREGCGGSYRAGLAALDPRAEAVAVLLGDQPGVDHAVIDAVVAAWRRARGPMALAAYRDREGHPLIFARPLFDRLAALAGDKAAWKIVDARRDEVQRVAVDRLRPRDVNTREEYDALRSESAASGPPGAS
jgi:molybdenum cofactor cytidylyltransferase